MDLVIDVGNSNLDCGVFKSEPGARDLLAHFRLSTPGVVTTDELAVTFRDLLHYNRIDAAGIKRTIFCSVVPPLNHNITKMMGSYFKQGAENVLQVTTAMFPGWTIRYEKPDNLGIDRLVNLKAALTLAGGPVIVVDFGTATTVDAVDADKVFRGGLIIPGVAISLDGLVRRTSQLPRIELDWPKRLLGNSTREAMQNGVYWLNSYGVDSIIARLRDEEFPGQKTRVIATGGLSNFIARGSRQIDAVEPHLMLLGLKMILDESPRSPA